MSKTQEYYISVVNKYDEFANKVVMKNDELHTVLVDTAQSSRENLTILDLGIGTAHGASLLLKKFPNSFLTGIDFSSEMLNATNHKLSKFGKRFKLIESDLTDWINSSDETKYDILVSAVTIHNITHAQKKNLFKKIYSSLSSEGIFINADFIEAESKIVNNEYRQIYKEYLEKNLIGKDLQKWLQHALEFDKPMKLSEQFNILKEVGFREVNLIWQFVNEAVYVARK